MSTFELGNGIEEGAPRSQATLAYQRIRGDILSGRHIPGKKLKIQDLADELKVSPGAIREALSRLVPAQLVVSRDQRGFAVAPLSIADLEDLTNLRCEIDAIALRRSVELGDVNWEAGLLAAAHRLKATPMRLQGRKAPINPDWVAAHGAFHAALVAACGSPRLRALHAHLYEQSERYRQMSAKVDSNRNVDEEHQAIFELALAHDANGLVDAMSHHLRMTAQLIVDASRQQSARHGGGRTGARSRAKGKVSSRRSRRNGRAHEDVAV
jgi:GntR family carbon starvation induced transcriptional regulator